MLHFTKKVLKTHTDVVKLMWVDDLTRMSEHWNMQAALDGQQTTYFKAHPIVFFTSIIYMHTPIRAETIKINY